jgi:NAD(P)-dependent dehydrogenase (short-subunit alcohol dehydrogenase family)
MSLAGKTILITGAAVRIGRSLARAVAGAGGNVILHYGRSAKEAQAAQSKLQSLGAQVHLAQADLNDPAQVEGLMESALSHGPLFGLVNNASIFADRDLAATDLEIWQRHMQVNLTAPFLLSRAFAAAAGQSEGRIVNILDWRALRPGADHFAYTISKAGLAALTRSLAAALAPAITVNGLALGAILPPSGGDRADDILAGVPAGRWARLDEVNHAVLFLLDGPTYITGEILHVDGGRHLI